MPTYNIVNQGADNTGNTPIDSVLNGLRGDDTTVIFPSGTYRLNGLTVPSGTDNFELIAPNGARLVPGQSGNSIQWIGVSSLGFVMDGFELDMRNTPVPPYVQMNSNSGNWELRRLITRGRVRAATDNNIGSNNSGDARTYFRLSSAAGTRGLLQDCYFQDGSCAPTEASNRRAILVESSNGSLTFNRCWFESWAENTIYAKNPEGKVSIYNCFQRNTQNGMRLGGNSEVRNCVSIKNAQHPTQAWSGGSLQRGVNSEATVAADPSRGINTYDGTLAISESDFLHRYLSSSCGGPITAPAPCQRIDIRNVRISYDSTKNHSAIYTHENGGVGDLDYLQLQNVQVTNDNDNEYAIFIGQVPQTWGTVSGVLGGSGPQTNSTYISDRMTINGNPTQPITTPPAPTPAPVGQVPMQNAQVVRIDNTGNSTESTFDITAGTYVGPGGDDGATVYMNWASTVPEKRIDDSKEASGTIPAGEVYVFYVTGGIVSTDGTGPANWTVDGEPFTPGDAGELLTQRITTPVQKNRTQWRQVNSGVPQDGVVIAKPLSFNDRAATFVRLRDVEDGGFEYQLQEWFYLDGRHGSETFHTLGAETREQTFRTDSGTAFRVKGGRVTVNTDFITVSLGDFFGTQTPVVLAQPQTNNGGEPVISRLDDVTNDSFAVRLQEEEAKGPHTDETVGYVALQQATGEIDGQPFEVQRTANTFDDQWNQITFEQQYDSPRLVADMQTFDGTDPATLRYRNLTGSGVEIKVQEEQSVDREDTHNPETIGYAVFEGDV
ncbi:hypothetical protein [Haladaptatus sp. DYF46]|uniref:hypothetical protein n=1 Tax=Haladaptatus sp. DYF46 TaxID=2886041 RepID=UPI001E4A2CB0|nr:hypothetical protein [Haladaptatus sp. DYF46]